MNTPREHWLRTILRVKILSPANLVLDAALIAVVYGICEAAGLREHTTFLSGTTPTPGGNLHTSAGLAVIYMMAWFGFALLAPILLVAAALWATANRFMQRR